MVPTPYAMLSFVVYASLEGESQYWQGSAPIDSYKHITDRSFQDRMEDKQRT